jgi:hypothetical protein
MDGFVSRGVAALAASEYARMVVMTAVAVGGRDQ